MISKEQLAQILPQAKGRINNFYPHLIKTMEEFQITTPKRMAAFIAQLAHESGQFVYVEEIASGKAYDTGSLAKRLGNTPEADGDGQKYKGRGLIQITGKDNYAAIQLDLGIKCLDTPALLTLPENACRSAGWFWNKHNLNNFADKGDFLAITKKINGGINGQADRLKFYQIALGVLL